MPQRCTICTRENAKNINAEIAKGGSLRSIAKRFKVTSASLYRHTETCLKTDISALIKQSKQTQAVDFHDTLKALMLKSNKIGEALEDWLTDPDNPTKFDISPRGDELTVIYLDWKDTNNSGEPKRKKATLQTLLNRVELPGAFEPVSVMSSAVDNRKLYLETVRLFGDQLERFAKYFPPADCTSQEEQVKELFRRYITPESEGGKGWTVSDAVEVFSNRIPGIDFAALVHTNNADVNG